MVRISAVLLAFLLSVSAVQASDNLLERYEFLHWFNRPPLVESVICDTGRPVSLAPSRYDNVLVKECDSSGGWLLTKWISDGNAVFNGVGVISKAWLTEFRDAEDQARLSGNGGWRDFKIQKAEYPETISTKSKFQIVQGTVYAMKKHKGVFYLNFGSNWQEDFTAVIPSHLKARFNNESWNFDDLVNMSIRVRGTVRQYNGPFMEIEWPAQIEVLPNLNDGAKE